MAADKMFWTSMMRGLSLLLIIIAFVLVTVIPEPVKCVPQKLIPFARMNQSFQDNVWKHKFLNQMMGKLLQSDIFMRNSTVANGQQRGTYSPRFQNNTQFSGTLTPNQLLYNLSTTERLVTNTLPAPKDYVSRLSPPNLVYSEGVEKNVLLFRFRPNTIRNNTQVNRINLWLYVWTKDNKEGISSSPSSTAASAAKTRSNLKSDRRRGKNIKIRVFLSDEHGFRGPRIAELKTSIKSSSWGKLGLPVSLMSSLAETETLRLRIECKRCSRKTQVVLPGNSDSKRCKKLQKANKKKKKGNRIRRWRKHCSNIGEPDEKLFPFIVIEEKSRNFNGRVKRTLEAESDTNHAGSDCYNYNTSHIKNSDKTILSTYNSLQCCTPFKTFVDFAELNLDQVIVYPSGFEFAACSDGCLQPATSFLDNVKRHLERLLGPSSSKICKIEPKSGEQSSLLCRAISSTDRQHTRLRLHHKPHRHSQRAHWHKHKLSRLKNTSGGCFPVESQNLVILHFTREQNLARLELPRFLATRCACRSHLPLNKD
ncbi:hypothetical protein BsWGS_00230 [Bradybaena similaris]